MENINFISANELPEAEGEEVSVLCLENGEMKQKPASGLGGGTVDGIIYNDTIPCYFSTGSVTVTSFDFAAIKEKLLAGKEVAVMLHSVYNYGDEYESWAKSTAVLYNSTSDTIAICWAVPYSTINSKVATVNASMIIAADGTVVQAGYITM